MLADIATVGGPEALAAFRESQQISDTRNKITNIEWRPPPKMFKFVRPISEHRVALCAHIDAVACHGRATVEQIGSIVGSEELTLRDYQTDGIRWLLVNW